MHYALLFQGSVSQEILTPDLAGHSTNWHHATTSWQYDVTHINSTEGAGNDLQQGCTTCRPPGCVTRPAATFLRKSCTHYKNYPDIPLLVIFFKRVARKPAQNNGCGPLPKEAGYPWFAEKRLAQEGHCKHCKRNATIQHFCIISLLWNQNHCYGNYRVSAAWNAKQHVKKAQTTFKMAKSVPSENTVCVHVCEHTAGTETTGWPSVEVQRSL